VRRTAHPTLRAVPSVAALFPAVALSGLSELWTLPEHTLGAAALSLCLSAVLHWVAPVVLVGSAVAGLASRLRLRASVAGVVGAVLVAYATLVRYPAFLRSPELAALFLLFLGSLSAVWGIASSEAPKRWKLLGSLLGSLLLAAIAGAVSMRHMNIGYPTLLAAMSQLRFIALHAGVACLFLLLPRPIGAGIGAASLLVVGAFLSMHHSAADARTRGWVRSETGAGIAVAADEWSVEQCVTPPTPMTDPEAENVFREKTAFPSLPDDFDAGRLNVVLITAEAVRADHTYLSDPARTPALAALARKGISFRRAYTPASRTILSLGSLFSMTPASLAPVTIRVPGWNGDLRPETETLAELFAHAGYETHAIRHDDFFSKSIGFDRGFGSVFRAPHDLGSRAEIDETLATRAIERLHALASAKSRFFLWVFFASSHFPYLSDSGSVPERYAAGVAHVDHELGRILESLRATGLERDTIVVFTADHGEELGEHGEMGNHGTTVNSEVLHVPLVVRIPRVAPREIRDPTSITLVFPWLLRTSPAFRPAVTERIRRDLAPALDATGGAVVSELFDANTNQLALIWPREKLDVDIRADIRHLYAGDDLLDARDLLEGQAAGASDGLDAAMRFRKLRACLRRSRIEH
jgi:hypothetical protein